MTEPGVGHCAFADVAFGSVVATWPPCDGRVCRVCVVSVAHRGDRLPAHEAWTVVELMRTAYGELSLCEQHITQLGDEGVSLRREARR